MDYSPSDVNKSVDEFLLNLGVTITEPPSLHKPTRDGTYSVRIESRFGMVRNFTIFGVNPKTETRDLTSIVALDRSSPDAQYYVFVRGDHITMKNLLFLKQQEKTHYRNAMVKYKNLLLNRLVYAYRKLSDKEMSKYHTTYARMVFNNRVESAEIDRLAASLENNLRFIGCLGLKTKIKPDAVSLLRSLKEAELKTSILSGDTFENTLNVARELKLFILNYND